jgi:acyl-coenzyme A synthetase/AMP-(fatty) acid ligase
MSIARNVVLDHSSIADHLPKTGWMMWNYMMAGLACGSRVVLYDGSPLHPTPSLQVELLHNKGQSGQFFDFLPGLSSVEGKK